MKTASTLFRGGAVLHVDDVGGSGLPVVFQHGLCGDARQTAEVFPENLAFRRLTLECRGHGFSQSGDINEFSLSTFTDDLIALIETIGSSPVVIGGISMGAAIALRLAAIRPELVRGLILARPAWIAAAAPDNMRPNAEVATLLATLPPDEARAAFVTSETAKRLSREAPDNLNSLVGFFDRPRPTETAALLGKIASDGPHVTTEQVRALDVPTIVIGTAHDLVHPLAFAETLATLIPNARLALVTSKVENRALYVSEIRNALDNFLEQFV